MTAWAAAKLQREIKAPVLHRLERRVGPETFYCGLVVRSDYAAVQVGRGGVDFARTVAGRACFFFFHFFKFLRETRIARHL